MNNKIKKGNLNYDQSGRAYPDNPQIKENWNCIWEKDGKHYKLVGDNEHKEWEEIENQYKVMSNLRTITLTNPSYTFVGIYPKLIINFDTNKNDTELDGMIVDGTETTLNKVSTTVKCKLSYKDGKLTGEKIK
jgi:hypothetical protein